MHSNMSPLLLPLTSPTPPPTLPLHIRHTALASLMLLRLLIINQRIPTLIVPMRHLARYLDHIETAFDGAPDTRGGLGGFVCFDEDAVHFFEGAVGCFGVEEVDYGEDEGVYCCEDYCRVLVGFWGSSGESVRAG
jgi:hypothetical protein